jgi:hypothetical protein
LANNVGVGLEEGRCFGFGHEYAAANGDQIIGDGKPVVLYGCGRRFEGSRFASQKSYVEIFFLKRDCAGQGYGDFQPRLAVYLFGAGKTDEIVAVALGLKWADFCDGDI